MALWPFTRRRSSRKRPRSGGAAALPDSNLDRSGPGSEATPPPPMAETAPAAARQKKRRTMHEPQPGAGIENNSSIGANTTGTRLRRRTRVTTSFSPGPHDSIHITTAVSGRRGGSGGGGSRSGSAAAAGALQPTAGAADASAMRAATLNQDYRQAPTLWSQRGPKGSEPGGPATTVINRKSSRLGRGAGIKALSTSHLTRPATEGASAAAAPSGSWIWSGQPVNRDSRRSRSAGFALASGGRETSDISLPSAESIHSSLSSDFEYAFRVSTLDSLAPRPTLRYNSSSRLAPGAEDEAGGPSRRPSQRNRYMSEPIPAALLEAHRRIDDLADDLDASSLRVLMERDQRRRARKEQQDRERAERRLARRATAQLQEEDRARATSTPLTAPSSNMESRVLDREVDHARTPSPPQQQQRTPAREPILVPVLRRSGSDMLMVELPDDADSGDNNRDDSGDDQDVVMTDAPGPDPEPARPETTQTQPVQPRAERSREEAPRHTPELDAAGGNSQMPTPPHSPAPPNSNDLKRKKSVSRSSLASEQGKFTVVKLPRPEEDLGDRPSPSTPSPRPAKKKSKRLSISTFFKWRGRSKGPVEGQSSSSFSNTSREEGLAAAAAASGSGGPSIRNTLSPIKRVGSNVPKRTRSRFREDLPELPISPPSSSRIHSPESDAPMSQMVAGQPESNASMVRRDDNNDDDDDDDNGNDVRTSDQRGTPVSWRPRTHSPEPLAVSLGSIDSEGSWFGGGGGGGGKARVISRTVSRATRHQSPSRRRRRSRGSLDSSGSGLDYADDAAIVEDDYMARLTPRTQQHTLVNRESVGEGRPSSDEDGELVLEPADRDAKWGSVEARQYATVVHSPPLKTVRSREGLLNSYPAKEEPPQAEEEGEDECPPEPDEDSSRRGTRNSSVSSAGCGVLARATSVSLGKGRVRRISLTNMRLVDLTPPPTSAEESPTQGRRKSTGTILG